MDVAAELMALVKPAAVSVGSKLINGILVSVTATPPGPPSATEGLVAEADPLAGVLILPPVADPEAAEDADSDHCHPMTGLRRGAKR